LRDKLPNECLIKASYRTGFIETQDEDDIYIPKALFDTGALHANYISKTFMLKHQSALSKYIVNHRSNTILGDGKTKVSMDKIVILNVRFEDDLKNTYSATLPFCIFEMAHNDMIIGLPAILRYFTSLLVSMIYGSLYQNVERHSDLHLINDDLVQPWSDPSSSEAPEDANTPIPCSFPTVLHFMELSYNEAVKEYLGLIPSQVSPDFLKGTAKPLLHLLQTLGTKVFVPSNWEGLKGIPPIHLELSSGAPTQHRPKARPISPKLWENASKELQRLQGYMYRPSISPIASPIVVAPKATAPFIRICGDYTWLNTYLLSLNYPIPHVQQQLEKICSFKIFLDLDMTNSFHQIPITPETSAMLSVVTPLGQFEPIFLPEGIPPASQILQRTVIEIFQEFLEWMIVIFDNFLILAHSYDDAYDKLERVFHRCIERNLVLKFKKSFLGFPYANFFGYVCHPGHFSLSDKRKSAIQDIPFPTKLKEMQSFLGAANFFSSHVPRYSEITAPLFGMLHKTFDWGNRSAWTEDYEAIFRSLKDALLNSCSIFYPDYSLAWTLRTDASIVGVSAALFQLSPSPNNTLEWQPIGLASHKFSDVATRWTTIEQEAYGCYFGILSFESKLRGKHFLLETDHRNLIWMEKSVVPKIVRWVLYMKSFSFDVRHVPGKLNNVADHLSRYFNHHLSDQLLLEFPDLALRSFLLDSMLLHSLSLRSSLSPVEDGGEPVPPAPPPAPDIERINKLLQSAHNARRGHWGLRSTMKILDKLHPGHRIPVQTVSDFIAQCPICQKNRQGMIDSLQPIVRHLKPEYKRKTIGVDMLTITPTDKFGNSYLIVIVVHFTKLAWGYPSSTKDASALVKALVTFFSIYGLYDTIMSDPGSDLTSNLTEQLEKMYGVKHIFSLVNRHESNGVEGTNKQILRHLRALVHEERIVEQWSSPTVLPVIFFIINSHVSSETGLSPFEAHFGSDDATYLKVPSNLSPNKQQHEFLRLLNDNLKTLTAASKNFQDDIVKSRTRNNDPDNQNMFQPGDYVLLQQDASQPRSTKLAPKYLGPYQVISQLKNDVTARHMSSGVVKELHVENLKRFYGTTLEAKSAANIDQDQYEVERIVGYRGDPTKRSTMQFGLLFKAGDIIWKFYCKDITDTQYFETFCEARPELKRLLTTEAISKAKLTAINQTPISDSLVNSNSFMNLRIYGYKKYSEFNLDESDCRTYLTPIVFGSVNKKKTTIQVKVKRNKHSFLVNHADLLQYCLHNDVINNKDTFLVA
jgi:hypothetical protein